MFDSPHMDMSWETLPEHVLVSIFEFLTLTERFLSSLVCQHWNEVFHSPHLWKRFDLKFATEDDSKMLKCLDQYGGHIRSLAVTLNQGEKCNRENACNAIKKLTSLAPRRLNRISIQFTGTNPIFYAGREFLTVLDDLFSSCARPEVNQITEVNFNRLSIDIQSELIDAIAKNCPQLKSIALLTTNLVCRIKPTDILSLVQLCKKLVEIQVYSGCVSDEVLLEFTEGRQCPPQKLTIMCRREEKYLKDLSSAAWRKLRKRFPSLRVTLGFDHTCPQFKIAEVMKPEIPVSVLRLETFSTICEELHLASQYYRETLEKLVIQTRPSDSLNGVLMDLATYCPLLDRLYVFCLLKKETIEAIFRLHPNMAANERNYILKHVSEPWMESWVAGNEDSP